jgi:hypothetical protein
VEKKITQAEVTATKISHNGAYECSALVDGHLRQRVYYGYTKREAIRDFATDINAGR